MGSYEGIKNSKKKKKCISVTKIIAYYALHSSKVHGTVLNTKDNIYQSNSWIG